MDKNNTSPVVSVVIPVHNGAKSIYNCLNSLKKQSFKDFEAIVVDDGSTDNTLGEIERVELDNLVLLEPGKIGRANARNLAIKKAKGKIICFTDADCIVEEKWIEKLAAEFGSGKIGAVFGSIVAGNNNPFVVADQLIWLHSMHPSMQKKEQILGATANMAIQRKVLAEVGDFDARFPYAEDSDLCARITKKGYKNIYSPKIIVKHYPERTGFGAFLKQRYNYAIGSTIIFLKYKDILPLGKFFPNSPILLFLLIPVYTVLSTFFVLKNNFGHSKHVILYLPLIFAGRFVEAIGSVKGAMEFNKKFAGEKNVS